MGDSSRARQEQAKQSAYYLAWENALLSTLGRTSERDIILAVEATEKTSARRSDGTDQ